MQIKVIRLYICHRFDKYLVQASNREEVCIGNGCGDGGGGSKLHYACLPYQSMVLLVPL